ncbi:glycosyltransferase [Terrihabitans sp. B22-R8]|uniref:glycosyltransferase n=1 Tax=Terrihabitans sp. B22-R8 TaxID=3425128 RepID=UPI00403C3A4A
MRPDDPGFFQVDTHIVALEHGVVRALSSSNHDIAFRLADRLCRLLRRAEPPHLNLLAEALRGLGHREAALATLERAIEIAPDDLATNRRLLAWADPDRARIAAQVLIPIEHDPAILARAAILLRGDGMVAIGTLTVIGQSIEGWAAWQDKAPLDIHIETDSGVLRHARAADPRHPLGQVFPSAAGFHLSLPPDSRILSVSLSQNGDVFHSSRFGASAFARPNEDPRHTASLTIIVPVYADVPATTACLDSVVPQLASHPDWRLVIVDDAAPEPAMGDLLSRIALTPNVVLVRNSQNLGFVETVNRGLACAIGGDVLLLNADTIVPPGAIQRLAAAAHSAPDIGTVTPLSNNGEFTSLPVPFTSNPLPASEAVAEIDRSAASANVDNIIDLPNGIGFCLYVTRTFLDAVGPLSADYHRGYLEDVDWCLRGRRVGLRSVCAGNVYVGHEGSRSFRREKRSLVVRNLAVLERRFPDYRAECASFLALDPLAPARSALQRHLLPALSPPDCLLFTGPGTYRLIAEERARRLAEQNESAMIVEVDGDELKLTGPDGGLPHAACVDFGHTEQRACFRALLRNWPHTRIEITQPSAIGPDLMAELAGLGRGFDVLIADAEVATIPQARRLFAPDSSAAAFARDVFPAARIHEVAAAARPRVASAPDGPRRLGIVPLRGSAASFRALDVLIRELSARLPELGLVVIGRTLDDLALMQVPNTFVTGPVLPGDIAEATRQHGITHALILPDKPLFGHPIETACVQLALPLARFSWSGPAGIAVGDLHLTPDRLNDPGSLAAHLAAWIGGAHEPAGPHRQSPERAHATRTMM